MKFQQSYVLWAAAACTAMTTLVAGLLVDDARPRGSSLSVAVPQAMAEQSNQVTSARVALRELTFRRLAYDSAVQLPVAPVMSASPPAVPDGFDANAAFQLTTIAAGEGGPRSAIVSGRLVHPGDQLDSATVVVAITPDTVRIRRAGQISTLTLHTGNADAQQNK